MKFEIVNIPVIIDADRFRIDETITATDRYKNEVWKRVSSYHMDLREKKIRETLIKLGWTPPKDK